MSEGNSGQGPSAAQLAQMLRYVYQAEVSYVQPLLLYLAFVKIRTQFQEQEYISNISIPSLLRGTKGKILWNLIHSRRPD